MSSNCPPDILDSEDLQRPRRPAELAQWVTETLERLALTPEGKACLRLGRGLAKQLVEEVYPLSVLAAKLYADRADLVCVPVLGNQNYDAVFRDMSVCPVEGQKVEITQASTDYSTHLRMLHLEDRGWAPMLGTIRREDGQVVAEGAAMSEHALVEVMLAEIAAAAQRKSKKPYGQDTVLLIFCEDAAFDKNLDQSRLHAVVQQIRMMCLDFASVHIVGARGRLFESFSLH